MDKDKTRLIYDALIQNSVIDSTTIPYKEFTSDLFKNPDKRDLVYKTLTDDLQIFDKTQLPFEDFEFGILNNIKSADEEKEWSNKTFHQLSTILKSFPFTAPISDILAAKIVYDQDFRNTYGVRNTLRFTQDLTGMIKNTSDFIALIGDTIGLDEYSDELLKFNKDLQFEAKVERSDNYLVDFLDDLSGALGSQAGFVALAFLNPFLAAGAESAIEGGGVYSDLKEKGNPNAVSKSWTDFGINIPVILITNALGLRGQYTKSILKRIGLSFFFEGIQETQQENLSAYLTDETLTLWDQAKIFLVGGALGGGGRLLHLSQEKEFSKVISKVEDIKETAKEELKKGLEASEVTEEEYKEGIEELNSIKREKIIEKYKDILDQEKEILDRPIEGTKVDKSESLETEEKVKTYESIRNYIKENNKDLSDDLIDKVSRQVLNEHLINTYDEKIQNFKLELLEKFNNSQKDGLTLNQALETIVPEEYIEKIKDEAQKTKAFMELQSTVEGTTLDEIIANTYEELYKTNSKIYTKQIVDIYLKNEFRKTESLEDLEEKLQEPKSEEERQDIKEANSPLESEYKEIVPKPVQTMPLEEKTLPELSDEEIEAKRTELEELERQGIHTMENIDLEDLENFQDFEDEPLYLEDVRAAESFKSFTEEDWENYFNKYSERVWDIIYRQYSAYNGSNTVNEIYVGMDTASKRDVKTRIKNYLLSQEDDTAESHKSHKDIIGVMLLKHIIALDKVEKKLEYLNEKIKLSDSAIDINLKVSQRPYKPKINDISLDPGRLIAHINKREEFTLDEEESKKILINNDLIEYKGEKYKVLAIYNFNQVIKAIENFKEVYSHLEPERLERALLLKFGKNTIEEYENFEKQLYENKDNPNYKIYSIENTKERRVNLGESNPIHILITEDDIGNPDYGIKLLEQRNNIYSGLEELKGEQIEITTALIKKLDEISDDGIIKIPENNIKEFIYRKSEKSNIDINSKKHIENLYKEFKELLKDKEKNADLIKAKQNEINEAKQKNNPKTESIKLTPTKFELNILNMFYDLQRKRNIKELPASEFKQLYKDFVKTYINLKFTKGEWGSGTIIKNFNVGYGTDHLLNANKVKNIEGGTYLISDYDYEVLEGMHSHPYNTELKQLDIVPLIWVQIYTVTDSDGNKYTFAHELQSDILRDFAEDNNKYKSLKFPSQLSNKISFEEKSSTKFLSLKTIKEATPNNLIYDIMFKIINNVNIKLEHLLVNRQILNKKIVEQLMYYLNDKMPNKAVKILTPNGEKYVLPSVSLNDFDNFAKHLKDHIEEYYYFFGSNVTDADKKRIELERFNDLEEFKKQLNQVEEEIKRTILNKPKLVNIEGKQVWRRLQKLQQKMLLKELTQAKVSLKTNIKFYRNNILDYKTEQNYKERGFYFLETERGRDELRRFLEGELNRQIVYYSQLMYNYKYIEPEEVGEVIYRVSKDSFSPNPKERKEAIKNTPLGQMLENSFELPLQFFFSKAKKLGYNTVFLPSSEAVNKSQNNSRTAALYATSFEGKETGKVFEAALKKMEKFGAKIFPLEETKDSNPNIFKHPMLKVDLTNWQLADEVYFQEGELKKDISDESQKPIQTSSQTEKMLPASSNEEIKANRETTVGNILEVLSKQGIEDESIKNFADWVFGKTKNLKVHIVNSNTTFNGIKFGDRLGAYFKGEIYLNKDKIENADINPVYNTLLHESIHDITSTALDDRIGNTKFNRGFRKDVEHIYNAFMEDVHENDEFYNKNKEEIKRIEFDENLTGIELQRSKTRAIKEFTAYLMSNTAPNILKYSKEHKAQNSKDSYFRDFINKLKALFRNLLGNKDISYYDAMEVTFAKHFDYTIDYKMLLADATSALEKDEEYESDLANFFNEGKNIDAVNIKNLVNILTDGTARNPYLYIKTKTKEQLKNLVNENKLLIKSIELYHKLYHIPIPITIYKERLITKLHNLATSLERRNIQRLIINEFGDGYISKSNYKLEPLGDTYYDKNYNEKSAYQYDTMINHRVDNINEVLNSNLELIYLDEVKKNVFTYNGQNYEFVKTEWNKINSNDYRISNRNIYYANVLKDLGILFPGTFSDKNTVIAFKGTLDKETVDKYIKLYSDNMNKMLKELYENKKFTEDDVKNYTRNFNWMSKLRDNIVLRLVMEDLRLGAALDENGNFNSVLFNPEDSNTYDLTKMFKRSTDVMPLHKSILDSRFHKEIYDNLQDRNGISLDENGYLQYNTAVVTEEDYENQTFTVKFKNKEIAVPISSLLINEYGIPNFDGANVHIGGFGEVITNLNGTLYDTPKKGKILNEVGESPYYNKGAFFYTDSKPLTKWMRDNNIALLSSQSAVKINPNYKASRLFDTPNVFKSSFKDYYFDFEKKTAHNDAKGLSQSMTTLYNSKLNKNYLPKSKEFDEKLVEDLSRAFVEEIYKLTPEEIIDYTRKLSLNSTNKHTSTISNILNDYLYKIIGNKVEQQLSDEYLGYKIGNIFLEPYVSKILKSYVQRIIDKYFNYQVPSTWMTLRPDFGWLESQNIEAVYENIRNQKKNDIYELEAELIKLEDTIEQVSNITKEESTAEIKELTKQYEELDKKIKKEENNFEENILKELYKIVDEQTGRLKDDWMYVSNDIKDVKDYDVEFNNRVLSTIIPGTDLASQFASKVAAILNKKEKGFVTYNSEFVQGEQGRDFDIDQLLLTPKSKYFTNKQYEEYVNSANESKNKYVKNKLDTYRKVLEDNTLQSKDLNQEVHKKFMQKVTDSELKFPKVINPSHFFEYLDEYYKSVGSIINENKTFTLQSQIGFKSSIEILGKKFELNLENGLQKYSVIASRRLNDALDKPSNTNSFFYKMNDMQIYDIVYFNGELSKLAKELKLNYPEDRLQYKQANPQEKELYDKINTIKEVNRLLFKYAIGINKDYNIEDREFVRGLKETLEYINNQRAINNHLKNNTVLSISKIDKYGYIKNISIDDIEESPLLRSIEEFPINAIPNLETFLDQYRGWQIAITKYFMENDLKYAATIKETIENNQKFIKDFLDKTTYRSENESGLIHTEENKHLIYNFLATRSKGKNTELHLLKAQLIALVNPYGQYTKALGKTDNLNSIAAERFYISIFDLANEYAYPKLMNLILNKKIIRFTKNAGSVNLTTSKGKILRVSKSPNNTLLFEIEGYAPIDSKTLYEDQSRFGKALVEALTGKEGVNIFNSKTKFHNNQDHASMNRYNLSKLFNFEVNTNFEDRIQYAVELLNDKLGSFNDNEKNIFWKSLIGYPKGRILYPLNLIYNRADKFTQSEFRTQDKLLEIASKVKDKSGRDFLNDYIKASAETGIEVFEGNGLNKQLKLKNIYGDSETSIQNEVLFSDPKIKEEVVDEQITSLNLLENILSLINSNPKERNISFDGVLDYGFNILSGKIYPLDKLTVTRAVDSFAADIASPKVGLPEIALTKYKMLLQGQKLFDARLDILWTDINSTVDNLFKEYKDKGIKKEIGEIFKDINERAEKLPFGLKIQRSKEKDYQFTVNEKIYNNIESILKDNGIKEYKQTLINKAAINLRIIYDYLNPLLLKNIISYIDLKISQMPEGFAYAKDLIEIRKKFANRLLQFQSKGGNYIPRIYIEEKAIEMDITWRLLNELIKKEPNTEIKNLVKKAKEIYDTQVTEEEKEMFLKAKSTYNENAYRGIVFGWDMHRKIPDWFAKDYYEKENFDMHEQHRREFVSAITQAVNQIDSYFYEYESSKRNQSKGVRNQMLRWYWQIQKSNYVKREKIDINKTRAGDVVSFYVQKGNKREKETKTGNEKKIRGVINKITKNDIYLEIDEEKYLNILENKLKFYKEFGLKIKRLTSYPIDKFQIKTIYDLDGEYDFNIPMSIVEANDYIIKLIEDKISNRQDWGKYPKNDIYTKQYSDGKAIYPNGVQLDKQSVKLPGWLPKHIKFNIPFTKSKTADIQIPENMQELFQLGQKILSVFSLGMPGAGVKNFEESMWRTFQSIGFRNILFTSEKKSLSKLPVEAVKFKNIFLNKASKGLLKKEFQKAQEAIRLKDIKDIPRSADEGYEGLTKEDVRDVLAMKYLLEHGLGKKHIEVGSAYISNELENSPKLLYFFQTAEVANRIIGAYLYSHNAIFNEKITNVKSILNAIDKGVSRANSDYGIEVRSFMESNAGGRMIQMFRQFNSNQWDQYRRSFIRAYELDQLRPIFSEIYQKRFMEAYKNLKYNIDSFISKEKEIKIDGELKNFIRGRVLDPLIPATLAREFLQDVTVGSLLEFMYPGLRVGNPVNKIGGNLLLMLFNSIILDQEPDDWDFQEWIFLLLGFKFGMMGTLIPNLIWNMVFDRKRIIPINSRQVELASDMLSSLMYNNSPRMELANSLYLDQQAAKGLIGFNPFPHDRKYYNKYQREMYTTSGLPHMRILKLIEMIGR